MWGVIIFIKFDYLLGEAGLFDILLALGLSMLCQLLAASSLSAIATNGKFQSGGAYSMVVRSLGPAIGAAIGLLYFIGMALLATVEVLGSTEALRAAFHLSSGPNEIVSEYWDQVIFGCMMMLVLAVIRSKDGHWVHQISMLIMVVVLVVVVSCFGGMFGTFFGWGSTVLKPTPMLSWENIQSNLYSSYSEGNSFGKTILTLIYPTFIGIFQGANKVAELKDSYRSVPRGAFFSVLTSGVFYTLLFCTLAAATTKQNLQDEGKYVLLVLAFPSKWVSVIGTILIGLGSALSCVDVAPRILQSIAKDGFIPLLQPFEVLSGKSMEPRRAVLMTLALCLPAMFIPDIETVATYTSLAFLCMYASMNASCFVVSVLNLHSWRPQFKYYHWFTAFLGFVLSISIMFLMQPTSAGIMLISFLLLIIYVQLNGEKVAWGHGLEGIKYKLALSSLLGLEPKLEYKKSGDDHAITIPSNESKDEVDWRPQLLCYVKLDSDGNARASYLLDFVQQLKGSKGLNMIATIIRNENMDISDHSHYYKQKALLVKNATATLDRLMAQRKMAGFTEVITAPTEVGESTMIQTLGLGKLRPNTLVVGWPKRRDTLAEVEARAGRFLRFLGCATAFEKAVVSLKPGTLAFPSCNEVMKGTIDIWWVVHDGGLLLLLAHLLKDHTVWSGCTIRIFTVVGVGESPMLIQRALAEYLRDVRITAEVHVVDILKADVHEFCNEWTLRAERYKACNDSDHENGPRSILLKRGSTMPASTNTHKVCVYY